MKKITQQQTKGALCVIALLLNSGYAHSQSPANGAPPAPFVEPQSESEFPTPSVEAIDFVWSGHRVWFDFVSLGKQQIIAYYDASRQMTVAHRTTPQANWRFHKLESFLGWDSHNSVSIGVDEKGYIHVVGNIHADPLVYFKSQTPMDVRTLQPVHKMIGDASEQLATYPHFFNGKDGELYFKHRYGGSGNGNEVYNIFDTETQKWNRLYDTAFVDGEGERNGYFVGPKLGPDGYFHISWVWRETPIASSNHDISYARSKNLISWENSNGEKIDLPIKLATAEIIAPIPQSSGLLNGHTPIGFDSNNNPIIAYQAYDKEGNSQLFITKKNEGTWKSHQVSNWEDSRQELNKGGALPTTLSVKDAPYISKNGNIVASATLDGVKHIYTLNQNTLAEISHTKSTPYPAQILSDDLDNEIPLFVKEMTNLKQKELEGEWFLTWEALPPNRDKARATIPNPSTLRLHHITK